MMEIDMYENKCACGCPTNSDICEDCEEIYNQYDSYDHEPIEDEMSYDDFDCTCGAWQWSEKQGKPVHMADCICGSSEPWN